MTKKFFISFVEEYWPNQKPGTSIGRIEVYTDKIYADEEIRWAADKLENFYEFREAWDFRDITEHQLNWLRDFVKRTYVANE